MLYRSSEMVINIASMGGRTHLLNTAVELHKLGHKVRFYSYARLSNVRKFGLPLSCLRSSIPLYAVFRLLSLFSRRFSPTGHLYHIVSDWLTSLLMGRCDLFIGQSPMHLRSLRKARERFGSVVILECGMEHVRDWERRLQECYETDKRFVPMTEMEWVEEGYKQADYLCVGSQSAKMSFTSNGIAPEVVFVNKYGFSEEWFPPTTIPEGECVYDLLMVSGWRAMKGARIIEGFCRSHPEVTFLHVGSLIDEFPALPNMVHCDAVNENELTQFYRQARVYVLPSYSEGMAITQLQALASGLPIVCSSRTGGAELSEYTSEGGWITEMRSLTVEEFERCVEAALEVARSQRGVRNYLLKGARMQASWGGYGKRYDAIVKSILAKVTAGS